MKRRQGNVKKAIVYLMSVLVFILTIEILARSDDKIRYDAPFFSHYSSLLLRTTDSEGINRNIAGRRFEKWKINRLGFRGPEIAATKPKGIVRIICMGTSETFGLYENPGQEWPSQLMDILKDLNHFQVINTSVVGLPVKKYGRYIEKYVLKLEPDVIILYLNPFDYAIGVEKFAERQTRRENNGNENVWKYALKEVSSNLRMLSKVKQAIKRLVPARTFKCYQLFNLKRQLRNLEYTHLNERKPLEVVPQDSLNRFRSDLEELIQFLRDQQIDIILSSYPVLISSENVDKYLEIFLDHRRFYIELSLHGIMDASKKFNNVIKSLATKHGIVFVDNNVMVPKDTRYFADNVHYTDEGARFIALNFAQYIKNRWAD